MKITRIESLHADAGWRNFDFLKISTDEGITGWSEYNENFGGPGLSRVIDELGRRGIELSFAELKGRVRERFEAYGVLDHVPEERLHRTVGEAVRAYVEAYDVDWVDWEDRPEP